MLRNAIVLGAALSVAWFLLTAAGPVSETQQVTLRLRAGQPICIDTIHLGSFRTVHVRADAVDAIRMTLGNYTTYEGRLDTMLATRSAVLEVEGVAGAPTPTVVRWTTRGTYSKHHRWILSAIALLWVSMCFLKLEEVDG